MAEFELQLAVKDAMTKAFAAKHPKARLAYMDLASFFASQLARQHGRHTLQKALITR